MSETESPKEILRTEAKRHRARFDHRTESADTATEQFFLAVAPTPEQVVAAFWPMDGEFDTRPLLDELLRRKFTCALPIVQKDGLVLRFAQWDDRIPLKQSSFGITEPVVNNLTEWVEPDIVIVPFLAFDRRGYRLGHGYGYYDATLAALRAKKKILAVGMGYAQQACLFSLPVEDHDQRLDIVVTPQGSQDFRDTE